jgi:hypothetical protein
VFAQGQKVGGGLIQSGPKETFWGDMIIVSSGYTTEHFVKCI